MKPENLVVDEALEEIEQPASGEHRTQQDPAISRRTRKSRRAKKHRRSSQQHDVENQVKIPILRVLALELIDGGGLAIDGGARADQMMPAQDRMKNDPVRKAPEPGAENKARPHQRIP